MRNQLANFIEILKLEMNDLSDDLRTLKAENDEKLSQELITHYVHMENNALYENELHAIKSFQRLLNTIMVPKFDSIDPLIVHLDEAFGTIMKSCGYAEVGRICIARKMSKVAKYVKGE
jgi:hypothetical protein